jgi:hypothetical protein
MDAYSYLTGQALRCQRNQLGEPNVRNVWLTVNRSRTESGLKRDSIALYYFC